ncbi:MAG: hypothetical protein QOF21_1658 [Actinomycetota bacterium]|jgi:hypothetical protein
MKRKTLDIIFSFGGAGIAVLLVALAVVMTSNANFSKNYVHDQLAQQKVVFPALATMTDEEKASPCVVANAGKLLQSGKQAECYANDFIGLHVKSTADGQTYAELGAVQSGLRAQVAAATTAKDPTLPAIQAELTTVTGQRESLFKGETLRGLLLTSFGFSVMGEKAAQAATVAYAGAALMVLIAAAGLVHSFRTAKTEAFAPVADVSPVRVRTPVHV